MPDAIAGFPLRNAAQQDLGIVLGRTYREYSLWHGQSTLFAGFVQDAHAAGVKAVMTDRIQRAFDFAQAEGIIKGEIPVGNALLDQIADHQMATANHVGRIGAIVMLHNACERHLWRLVRFGLVANRPRALTWIADRKVTIRMIEEHLPEVLADDNLEKWWEDLERDGLMKKWNRLVGLVGLPERLTSGTWHFDQDMLLHFDKIRHTAVHHDGQLVRAFDFAEFANQLGRAQLAWLVHVGRLLELKVSPEIMFFGG